MRQIRGSHVLVHFSSAYNDLDEARGKPRAGHSVQVFPEGGRDLTFLEAY